MEKKPKPRTITRMDLVDSLRAGLGFNRNDARLIVDGFFDEIGDALQSGESVKVSGFGVFSLRRKRERPGRNPKTGEEVMIKPRTVVQFHAGNKLRSLISAGQASERSRDFELIAE